MLVVTNIQYIVQCRLQIIISFFIIIFIIKVVIIFYFLELVDNFVTETVNNCP